MRKPSSFARRFIAGETIAEAIEAARQVEARGLLHTLDYLGESVSSLADADAATSEYRRIIGPDQLGEVERQHDRGVGMLEGVAERDLAERAEEPDAGHPALPVRLSAE